MPQDTGNKENAAPHKNLNASDKGKGVQFEDNNKGAGWNPL